MLFLAALVLAPKGESILVVDNMVVGSRIGKKWSETDVTFAKRHKEGVAFRIFGIGTVDRGPTFYGFSQDQPDGPTFISGDDANADRKPMVSGVVPRVPRPVRKLPHAGPYVAIAKAYADKRGLSTAGLRLTGVFQTDLEGDGTNEVLLSATSGKPGDTGWPKGSYSFVLLRSVKGQTALEFTSIPQSGLMDVKTVRGIADLDGDGRMEILTTGVAEEFNKATLWSYRAGVARKLVEGAAGH